MQLQQEHENSAKICSGEKSQILMTLDDGANYINNHPLGRSHCIV